ncbi:MAG: AlkA N-terminal domain-containing protein, partial [Salinisphaeraceae bacterium]|nr:AlkA N-terminal domain-containing protein [Salinisphaeraceae bacterium]
SPGTPAWNGTSAVVSRGLRLIEAGALDQGTVEMLASRLGLGPRHLSRLFQRHLGASPVAVAQTRRLHFAKKLIDETQLPMSEIALAAGFGSVRRFNAVFTKTYQRNPSSLRRQQALSSTNHAGIEIKLSYRPPYDWPLMLRFLSMRAITGVEAIMNDRYYRSIQCGEQAGWLSVQAGKGNELVLSVQLGDSQQLAAVIARIRAQFDLGAEPDVINQHLSTDSILKPLIRRHPGLRVPGAWDPFELTVRAILGQQISVTAASTLAERIVKHYGEVLTESPADMPLSLFPRPARLAEADFSGIGLTQQRASTLRRFASAVASGDLDIDSQTEPERLKEKLLEIQGIGPWTVEYVAMRALAEPDAFPNTDLGLLRATGLDAKALHKRAQQWRPWRAYAAMHLWNADSK